MCREPQFRVVRGNSHWKVEFPVQLSGVQVLDGVGVNMFLLHHAQRKKYIVLNDAGVHLFDGRLVFQRHVNSSSLSATRLSPSVPHNGMTDFYVSPSATLPLSFVEGVVPSPPSGFQPISAGVVPPHFSPMRA